MDLRRGLPPREEWQNWLTGESEFSQEAYAVVEAKWQEFGCRTLRDWLREYNRYNGLKNF